MVTLAGLATLGTRDVVHREIPHQIRSPPMISVIVIRPPVQNDSFSDSPVAFTSFESTSAAT